MALTLEQLQEKAKKKKKERLQQENVQKSEQPKGTSFRDVKAEYEDRTWFQKSTGNLWETILGSAGDVRENASLGLAKIPELFVDTLMAITPYTHQLNTTLGNAPTSHTFTTERMKAEAGEFIKQDLLNEEQFIDNTLGKMHRGMGIDTQNESVFGAKSDAVAQAGGQLVGQIGLQAVGVPWYVTTAMSSYGGEMENALNSGASFDSASGSALVTAGADILTEKLFGGSGLGEKGLINTDLLTKGIADKTVKTLADFGVDVVGEGAEEVVAGVFSNLGTALYKEENLGEILASEEAFEGYLESFIGGMVLGGSANVGKVPTSIKNKTDYRTGLTKNEQGMIDSLTEQKATESSKQKAIEKEVEKAIAERETSQGGTLSDANKEALKQSIMSKIDNGEIDTSSYQLSKKERAKIQQEIQEDLESGKFSLSELEDLATAETTSKIKDLESQLENAKTNEEKSQIENEIEKLRVDRMVELQGKAKENKFLGEAVYEKTQEYAKYTYDKAKVKDTFEQETRESATTHANNTKKTRQFVDSLSKLAKAKQTSIRITNNQELLEQGDLVKKDKLTTEEQAQLTKLENQLANARTENQKRDIQNQIIELTYMDNGGLVRTDANGKKTILVNIDSKQAMYEVVGHETRHLLEADNDINKTYNEKLFAYAKQQGDLEALKQSIKDTYNTEDVDTINSELSAKLTGKYLFENPKFLESIIKDSDQTTAQKIVSKIKEVIDDLIVHFKGTEQEKQLREIQKTFKEMYKQYSSDNVNPENVGRTQYSLSENVSINDKINSSMTMQEAKDMLQRVYNAGDIRGYRNADEWLREMGSDDVAMVLESDYALYKKYIESNEDILNEEYYIQDVLDAYLNGTLVGKKKEGAIRLDTSRNTGYVDSRFYAPQDIKGGKDLYNIASQRVTNANRTEVYKARADFIINAHNKGYIESLGLTKEEVNKKLKSWANYTPKAMNLSNSLNEGVATQNRWTGIENSTILNTISVTDEELGKLVKAIEGNSSEYQRQYITSTMLALDTHIDYKGLSFVFDGKQVSDNALGQYSDSTRTIYIKQAGQNTVAHEMGHYIDHLWGRDLGYVGSDGLTGRGVNLEKLNAEQRQFVKNFYTFLNDIENSSDIGSSYKQSSNEVFARFVARFTEWTKNQATNNRYGYEQKWYKDNFTERQYREFVKLLQEKAMLDTSSAQHSLSQDIAPVREEQSVEVNETAQETQIAPTKETSQSGVFFNGKKQYSLSDTTDSNGRTLTKEQQEKFKDSVVRDKEGNLIPLYHGTTSTDIFTEFNHENGVWLSTDYDYAKEYSGWWNTNFYSEGEGLGKDVYADNNLRIYEMYADIKNPFNLGEINGTLSDGKVSQLANALGHYVADKTGDMKQGGTVAREVRELANDYVGEKTYQFTRAKEFIDFAKKQGFDGFVATEEGKKTYCVFSSADQVKLVTNQNPTSNPDIRHSLSQDIAPIGNRLQDMRVKRDIAPVREDIETNAIAPSVTEQTVQEEMYAPVTEEEAHAMLDSDENWERMRSLQEAYEPQEIDAPIYTPSEIKVDNPFDARDIRDVGNRKEKAYMYENPEVKPFFQEEANRMLTELKNSIKGERHYNDQLYYESGGELGFYGTKRYTSDDIAYYLDNFKYTYAQIEQGLKDIIEDNGKENNAVSKRLEFAINDRLQYGYTDFMTGYNIEPNQDYVNLLADKQINTYSDEAFEMWAKSLEYAEPPMEDVIAPIGETVKTTPREVDVDTTDSRQLAFDTETGELVEEDLPTRTRKEIQQALLQEGNVEFAKSLDNAKNIPMALMNNTDTIRVTEMVFGRENGKKINELIYQKAIDNEAKSTRWQNQERADIKSLGIKARSKMSEAVQKYGEGQYVNEKGDVVDYDDLALASEFPNASDQQRIKQASEMLRQKYDQYIELANKVLTDLGFDAIPKRKDYFRHFQELNDIFTRNGLPFNPQNMAEHVLPTDINGLTDTWSPQKNYFANAQPRKGIKTTYDAIGGIDGYISGISNLIFHTEDIQRGRAFENLIRETYGQESGLENFDNMTPEEQQERIKKVHDNHLSNYASWVHEWTNNIAGKKSKVDRAIESLFGRKAFSVLDETRKQVGSNMIGFNVSSSMTNVIASIQALAKTNKLAVLKGTADTVKNIFSKDNFMEKNDFLTNRMGTEMLSKKPWEKMRDAGFVFMKGMDWFTSNQIVRSKYHELRAKGMSEARAHAEAGQFASRIMADRTKGAMPQIYNSKMLGVITQFQLEVNNQLYSMFYDTYHESKESAKNKALLTSAKMTFTLGQLMAYTHIFGKTFESLAGYNPTFDIIGIIATALGIGDDDDEEKTTSERLKEASDKLVDALPYVNILTGGGRVPVASGIPNLIGVATGGKDEYGNELKLKDEMSKLLYLVPPTGGNQIKKTTQGLAMFDEDNPVSGSYTESGNLRFPVEDTLANRVQAGLFGQWASKNAGEYFDRDIAPLKEKQIQEYQDLDLPISEYWTIRKGLAKQNKVDEKFDYIAGLDLPVDKKNILINNAVERDEKIDLTGYEDFSTYEEFDLFNKSKGKYHVSRVVGGYDAYKQYTEDLKNIKSLKDKTGKTISGSRKQQVAWYLNNLDADYYTKILLFKAEYPADDTYNQEIVEYLNNREDFSYQDMVEILTELGFKVSSDGTIRW